MERKMARIENKTVAFFVIIALAVLTFIVAKPFVLTIVSSMVLAYVVHPFYIKLKKTLRSPSLAAALLSIIVILLIALPVVFLLPTIVRQTFSVYTTLQQIDFAAPFREIAPKFFTTPEFTRDFTIMVDEVIAKSTNSIMGRLEEIIVNLPLIFMQFIVMLFIFFFTLRDNDKIVAFLKGLSPLKESSERKFTQKFNDITKSVVYGMFIIGIVQGILTGIGLYLFKVPQSLFLTILAIFLGVLPYIGTWAIWVPISIGLVISGNVQGAIAFAAYQLIAAGIIEVFIRPYIIKKQAKIPVPTVIIGMLGGGYAFGLIGLVIGPLILEYFILFLEFYRTKSLNKLFG